MLLYDVLDIAGLFVAFWDVVLYRRFGFLIDCVGLGLEMRCEFPCLGHFLFHHGLHSSGALEMLRTVLFRTGLGPDVVDRCIAGVLSCCLLIQSHTLLSLSNIHI